MLVKIFSFPICERHNIILSKLLFWNALFVCIAKILYIKADHNFQMLKSVLLWFTVTIVVDHCSLTCHYKLLHYSSLHVSRILSLMIIMQPEKHWEVFKSLQITNFVALKGKLLWISITEVICLYYTTISIICDYTPWLDWGCTNSLRRPEVMINEAWKAIVPFSLTGCILMLQYVLYYVNMLLEWKLLNNLCFFQLQPVNIAWETSK